MKTILFQGDSITDCGRDREIEQYMGWGYATMVAAELGINYPNNYEFINRGASGARVVDIYSRIYHDIIKLKPDVMSVLIGVNDVWHTLTEPEGISVTRFKKVYRMLIEDVLKELPDIKIMIMEPFILMGTDTQPKWDIFSDEVKKHAEAAREVAQEFQLPFIPLQEEISRLTEKLGNDKVLRDGVHPCAPAHELIKRAWLKTFYQIA